MLKILKNRKAQEELVGFAIIMIIVVVAILFFIVFTTGNKTTKIDQSYQADDFIQSALQYTTNCSSYLGNYSLEDLTYQCAMGKKCVYDKGKYNESSCQVLNSTLKGMLNAGWNVQNGSAVKGYEMVIISGAENLVNLKKGVKTNDYKDAVESFAQGSYSMKALLNVYY